MAEFIAMDQRNEVSGMILLTIITTMDALGGDARPYLNHNGLLDIQPGEWYSFQACLNTLKDISTDSQNTHSLESIGQKMPEFFPFPPEVDTVEKAFAGLDALYQSAHRKGMIGHYFMDDVAPRHLRVTAINPEPSDFDLGLCSGLARRFAPDPSAVKVVRAASPCRKQGDDRCIYDITW